MADAPPRRDPVRIVAAVLALAGVLATMAAGGPLPVFIDVPSILAVFGGGTLAWVALAGRDRAVLARVLRAPRPTTAELDQAELVALARRRAYWSVGLLTFLASTIQLASMLGDWVAFGPKLAVYLLPLFYTALADLFLASPAIARVRRLRTTRSPHALDDHVASPAATTVPDRSPRQRARSRQ